MSNSATKSDLNNVPGFDTSDFAKNIDFACLTLDFYRLYIDKLQTTFVDLYELSNVVEKQVAKRDLYHELVKKGNAIRTIGTSDLVKKATYNTKIYEIEKKVPDHDKYIATQKFNKLMSKSFAAKLKRAKMIMLISEKDQF